MAGRLPMIDLRWKGNNRPWGWGRWTRWYRDDRLGELRKVNNPHERLDQTVVAFAQLAGQVQVRPVEGEKGGDEHRHVH